MKSLKVFVCGIERVGGLNEVGTTDLDFALKYASFDLNLVECSCQLLRQMYDAKEAQKGIHPHVAKSRP